MKTEFDTLCFFEPEKEVGITSKKQDYTIRIVEDSVVINPNRFVLAFKQEMNPFNDSKEATVKKNFLKERELELFTIVTTTGTLSSLVKPANISVKDFLEI